MEPDSPGGGSTALRVAGFALLGVAAVATVIGLGTLATESNGSAAALTSSVSATATSSLASSAAPVTTTTTTTPAPVTTTAGVAPPAPAPPAPVRAPLRVYNNSTISGLAARAAADFRAAGWPVEAVGNYPGGVIPTSTVYFRPGSGEEAAARQLGAEFGLRVEPRFAGLGGAPSGVIVIVTNDYHRR